MGFGSILGQSTPFIVNPNLLDNWYFGNPVNQRGLTELASGNWDKYFIDRWIAASPECAYAITDDGIKISKLPHQYQQIWAQKMERMEKRTYTLSFFLKDIGLLSMTFTPSGSDYTEQTLDGGFIVSFMSEANLKNPMIRLLTSASVTVSDVTLLAAKLELGDTQTLAHKENGVWILNEIPDFGEQLRRCQMYHLGDMQRNAPGRISGNNTAYCIVPIPVTMRQSSGMPVQTISIYGSVIDKDGAPHVVNNAYCVVEADSYLLFAVSSTDTMPMGPCIWQDAHFSLSKDL